MRRFIESLTVLIVVAVTAALITACSGSQSNNRRGTTSEGESGPNNEYSEETKADFADAVKSLAQAQQGGLEENECERLADAFEEVHEDGGGVPEALLNAGLIWDKCGNTKRATQYFEKANEAAREQAKARGAKSIPPGLAGALIQLGVYAYREGNKGQAKRYFDQARESDRRSYHAYTNLGILQREREEWAEAQLNFRRALAVNSDFMTAFAQMALLYLEVAESNRQMLDIVELVAQQATARATQIKADPLLVAPIYNIWGLALIRKGDVVRAVEQFNSARRLDPNFFEAHMNYGAVNLSFRGFAEAEKAFRAAIQLHPDDYQAHLSLGAALRGLERYDEARSEYEKARQIDAAAPGAYYNLAVLMQDYQLSSAGDMDAQIKLLGKAKTVYREFLQKCASRSDDCIRRRPGEEPQDMREVAKRRINACEETISGLREAQALAAEAAALEQEAAAAQDQAPADGGSEGDGGGDGEADGGGDDEGEAE